MRLKLASFSSVDVCVLLDEEYKELLTLVISEATETQMLGEAKSA